MKRTAIEAFKETIKIFEEQCDTQERSGKDPGGHGGDREPERVLLNYEKLQSRLSEIHESKLLLEQELRSQAADACQQDGKIASLRPDLIRLRRIRDQHLA